MKLFNNSKREWFLIGTLTGVVLVIVCANIGAALALN